MKPPNTVLVSLILMSDIFASASGWKEKAKIKIDLQPSHLYTRCGQARYSSKEIDDAALEACYLKLTKGKILGIPIWSQPKSYKGNKVVTFDEEASVDQKYHHSTHVLNFEEHPFLMWPLKNKFRYLKAKCYAIIKWKPDRVKCKGIGVIMKEKGTDDVKCTQVAVRDSTSRYAGSSLYHPPSPNVHHPEGLIPLDDPYRRPSSVHSDTRVPPFNSNLQETSNNIGRAPSFKNYQQNIEITELEK